MKFNVCSSCNCAVISIFILVFLDPVNSGLPIESKRSHGGIFKGVIKDTDNEIQHSDLVHGLNIRGFAEFISELKPTARGSFGHVDPDANKNISQLIVSLGYPVEEYIVQTKDGFLLSIFRIPRGKKSNPASRTSQATTPAPTPRQAVFLQHGLISSAADWVMNFENDSLAFILADAGYDVWMGNSRGNTYSRRHVSLSPKDDAFWDWSFDEMAMYDTPACIDFILTKTGNTNLSYVGHSQGTMMAFALFSIQPEYEKKVNLFIGLAPIISLNYIESPIRYFSALDDELIYAVLGRKEFLPNDILVKLLVDSVCANSITNTVCQDILFVLCGPDTSNLNKTRIPVYLSHTPAGASVKDMVHFAQMIRSKRFAMYDYGSTKANNAHYGQPIPPGYNTGRISVPSVLFSGSNDWLADPKDVVILKNNLKSTIKVAYDIPNWNHLDFVYGIDADTKCYHPIVKCLTNFL